MIERGKQGLVVHDFEHNPSPERVKPKEVGYIFDGTCNSEVEAGLVDLQFDLAPDSKNCVGFWLEEPREELEARHEGVYLLRRSKDRLSFVGGYVAAIGENEDGEPEYSDPELFQDLPAEFVEDQLLCKPLEIGASNEFFDGMIVAKVGVGGGHMNVSYDRGRWGKNPISKIVNAQQLAHYAKS